MLSRRMWLLVILAIVCSAYLGNCRKRPATSVHVQIVLPKGYWGWFIIPMDKELRAQKVRVDVPRTGLCAAIPFGGYTFRANYDSGEPVSIEQLRTTQTANVPQEILLQWVQERHPKGMLWFLGTRKQYEQTFRIRRIGLIRYEELR